MASLNSRVSRLEKMAPDASVFPDPPRFAGRPHEVAIAEHIEWLQELLVHPHIPETGHSNIRSRISQLQTLYPAAEEALRIWKHIWNQHPGDDYQVNFQRYLEIRPHPIYGTDNNRNDQC